MYTLTIRQQKIKSAKAQPTRQTEEVCRQGAADANTTPPEDGGPRERRKEWKEGKKEK